MSAATQPIDVVRSFCAAWSKVDLEVLVEYFTDDAVYHNIPIAPVSGKEAIKATIATFMNGIEGIDFQIGHIVADGQIVMTERVDVFRAPTYTIELPVMGIFEVTGDGKISAWRDYFDIQQFMSQLPQESA